jgi:hypothetical protein
VTLRCAACAAGGALDRAPCAWMPSEAAAQGRRCGHCQVLAHPVCSCCCCCCPLEVCRVLSGVCRLPPAPASAASPVGQLSVD